MKSPFNRLQGQEPFATKEIAVGSGSEKLEVTVVFTDAQATLAALNAAQAFTTGLKTSIHLIAWQQVPYAYDLDQPPVSLSFTEHLLSDLVARAALDDVETTIHLYLCRSSVRTLLELLRPNSLVVIGIRKRWWRTAEDKLASALRAKGHQVIFASARE